MSLAANCMAPLQKSRYFLILANEVYYASDYSIRELFCCSFSM